MAAAKAFTAAVRLDNGGGGEETKRWIDSGNRSLDNDGAKKNRTTAARRSPAGSRRIDGATKITATTTRIGGSGVNEK
ncbi:hypothetical protein LINPERPRIM_LOCUS31421 [Linum perenne]